MEDGEYDFLLLQEFAKEVPAYIRGVGTYRLLQAYDEQVGELSQVVIVYRQEYRLIGEEKFIPFAKARRDPVVGFKHSTFGSLLARFDVGDNTVLAGSVHLHSGMNYTVRGAQMQEIKEQALALMRDGDRAIVGGDCNFVFPHERIRAEHVMMPEFVCVTNGIGPTFDGRYSENIPHFPNRIAALFRFWGIKISFWTDHLFVSGNITKQNKVTCRVLPDRVSDHNPIALILES